MTLSSIPLACSHRRHPSRTRRCHTTAWFYRPLLYHFPAAPALSYILMHDSPEILALLLRPSSISTGAPPTLQYYDASMLTCAAWMGCRSDARVVALSVASAPPTKPAPQPLTHRDGRCDRLLRSRQGRRRQRTDVLATSVYCARQVNLLFVYLISLT
jgi:hypothetical protein